MDVNEFDRWIFVFLWMDFGMKAIIFRIKFVYDLINVIDKKGFNKLKMQITILTL